MNRLTKLIYTLSIGSLMLCGTSCQKFVFGDISVNDEENPLLQKKTPRTGAEIYYGTEQGQKPLPKSQDATLSNPDAKGALANWYSCLVMFKEAHNHYGGKVHGNNVFLRGAWRQEQFAEIRNTPSGVPEVILDKASIRTFVEEQRGEEGPDYFRIIGGKGKRWGFCLYFYDKDGKLINDSILRHSDEYQIFFTISDKDSHNKPYKVMDVRYKEGMPTTGRIMGVEAEAFKGKDSFADRAKMTPTFFQYTYRDTWKHEDMGDGVRDYFNIKLLPPLTAADLHNVVAEDQDCVGLKGHFLFDWPRYETGLDPADWPLKLSEKSFTRRYRRQTYLLPKFYLAVRVLKCNKQKKALNSPQESSRSTGVCAPFYEPNEASGWTEIIRFNLPIKILCSTYDTDPTNIDPYEPFYYNIAREIGILPEDAFDAVSAGSGDGGLGYDSWFL